jgi:histidinol-phosphate aminotransferase
MGTVGAGAATLALRPLYSRNYLFASSPLPGTDNFVHLNLNENPYGPSPKALKAIRDSVSMSGRYYYDLTFSGLAGELCDHHELDGDFVVTGAGCTEILKLCDDLFLGPKPQLVVAEPTYDAVIQYAVNSKADAVKIPLTKDYRHDLAMMAEAVTPQTGMVYICNPNNPTGTLVTKDEMQRFMNRIPESVTVVVDEAYSHFAGPEFESAVKYVKEGRNVVVGKTFSKAYGLAGMRIGYALSNEDLIAKMRPFTVDYAISALSAYAASAALTDSQHVERSVRLIAEQRQALYAEMKKAKFEYIPSDSNFVMIDVRRPVGDVIDEFYKRKILVGREFPSMPNFLRLTIGTSDEMKKFFVAFREIFRG